MKREKTCSIVYSIVFFSFAVEQLRKNDVDSQRVGALALRPLLSIEAYRLRLAEDNNYQTVEMICNLIKAQSNRIQLVYVFICEFSFVSFVKLSVYFSQLRVSLSALAVDV